VTTAPVRTPTRQQRVLHYVRAHPGCSAGEVARALSFPNRTVRHFLDTLYVRGFVGRQYTLRGELSIASTENVRWFPEALS